ncbi:hypothetical protein INT45_002903 [Circinella minor]|uniref:Uncharacterized protein n=1 Tax=Circinella minor TaxID=1195481 RepID=A0A8H7RQD4_9FUNG|nr:hypothetical protein INT45_002903 [Circinella minor]
MIEKKILGKKKHLMQPAFEIGDTVQVFKSMVQTSFSGKIDETWDGPFIVVEKNNKSGYKLASMKGEPLKGTVHGNQLRSYKLPNVQFRPSFTSSNPTTDHLNLLQHFNKMNSNNQNNNFEDWLFPESNIQDSDPVTDNSIDIDVILNNFDTAVFQTDTDLITKEQTLVIETETTTESAPNSRSEDTLSGLEDYLQLMTGLKLSLYTQSLIQGLVWYETYRVNIKKNREEVRKNIANEIAGSANLSKFIKGKFTKGTKQILEANGVFSEELLNTKNQFRQKSAQELKKKLK